MNSQYSYLFKNLPIIEVCLFTEELNIVNFIMYLEYDIPFEQQSDLFNKLSTNSEFLSKISRGSIKEDLIAFKYLIKNIINYIDYISNNNNLKCIYKKIINKCNIIIKQIDKNLGGNMDKKEIVS